MLCHQYIVVERGDENEVITEPPTNQPGKLICTSYWKPKHNEEGIQASFSSAVPHGKVMEGMTGQWGACRSSVLLAYRILLAEA